MAFMVTDATNYRETDYVPVSFATSPGAFKTHSVLSGTGLILSVHAAPHAKERGQADQQRKRCSKARRCPSVGKVRPIPPDSAPRGTAGDHSKPAFVEAPASAISALPTMGYAEGVTPRALLRRRLGRGVRESRRSP